MSSSSPLKERILDSAMTPGEINQPFMVVVSPMQSRTSQVEFAVLLCPIDGLCFAAKVEQEEVFYFDEFRDGSLNVLQRQCNWNEQVPAALHPPSAVTGSAEGTSYHKHAAAPPSQNNKSGVSPTENIKALMSSLTSSRESFGESLALCQSTLDTLNQGPTYGEAMQKFIDLSADSLLADARKLVTECGEYWPDLKRITLTQVSLMKLRSGLPAAKQNGRRVALPMLRGFVAEGVLRVKDIPEKEQWQIDAAVTGLLDTVKLIIGPSD